MAGDDELPSLDDWDDAEWGPAHFLVPPPPPPPSLGSVCSTSDFYCQLEGGPMGAHFNRATFPSLPIIAVCSSVVLVAVLVASFLLWRHKTKVQNLLPCKNEQPGHLGDLGAANGVTYEDVLINHHPTRIPQGHLAASQTLMPLEILDVKLGDLNPSQISALHHTPCYGPRDTGGHVIIGGKPFNPVYEEVSQAPSGDKSITSKSYDTDFNGSGKLGGRSLTSEDDFAEDDFAEYPSGEGSGQCSATSSVRGSTGGDLCKDPVSSDEGTGEDCDYMINNLPEMLPSDNSFGYPRQPMHPHPDINTNKQRRNPLQPPHQHNTTYPMPERTANVLPPAHRVTDSAQSHKLHSKPLTDKRHMSPTHIPSSHVHSLSPTNPQWMTKHGQRDDRTNFPTSASQENIYSTIDEDELSDYPAQPPLPSLACSQRGSPPCKPSSGMPKSVSGRGDRAIPPLSQRNAEENGSSYGDIMPAFHSASFM
ncbi:uncharacterized protein TNIN_280681 [Trichonephila inaurata madagascariensis]|uniref:Uncharacterized protein n=1 Tax=Trichonephila inaurata madagascariensis TaxID=2747483 RepID=A0A8X7C6Z7_9ARAC|nr:uncharacterized protein TNIN_280681 [Trichonephila inaurata madagascariensis]